MAEISTNSGKINVSAGQNTVNVGVTKDYSQYYSQLSKDWATKTNSLVNNEDYSSKYYAEKSKDWATNSENNLISVISEHEQITSEITQAREDISSERSGALLDIETSKKASLTAIDNAKTSGIISVNTARDNGVETVNSALKDFDTTVTTAKSDINKLKDSSMSAVETAQTTAETSIKSLQSLAETSVNNGIANIETSKKNAISDISTAGAKQVANIKQTGFYMQDDKLYYINSDGETKEFSSDTIPLGWSTYQSVGTPSSAFLASLGQQNSGTFYPTFYNEFSAKIGQAFGAGFVKAHTASDITDYDLVINQDEQTFRLPLKNGKENLVGDEYIQISTLPANDATLTAPANGYYTISVFASATTSRFYMTNLSDNLTVGEGGATLSNVSWNYVMPCKKGDKIQFHYESVTILNGIFYFCPNIGNGTLYYKVSNAVQNLQLLEVAEMTTALAKKVDSTNTQWAVNACMPDYSAGKNVSSATIHTATVDGYVFAQAQSTSGGNGGHVDIYDKNGTLIKSWNYVGAEMTQTYSYSAFMCPIPKGYSYNVHGGVNIVIQFYPAKGTEV